MKYYIIFCNDNPEYVTKDVENANKKTKELSNAYYEKHKWNFKDREEYKHRCYWHLHEVEGDNND